MSFLPIANPRRNTDEEIAGDYGSGGEPAKARRRSGGFYDHHPRGTDYRARGADRTEQYGACMAAVEADRILHEFVLLPAAGWQPELARGESPGLAGHTCARNWRARGGFDGALRLRQDPRTRYSGGNRIDSDEREPRAAEAGCVEACVGGRCHRFGRSVRRRRPDHYDGWGRRVDHRAILPFDERGA